MDYCPNCGRKSIRRGRCYKCGGDFRVGNITIDPKRKRERPVALPLVREVMQTRLARVLRDPGWKYDGERRGCNIRYGQRKA